MNLQTILYFSSILLTCALTGFLAWYAWRQPHVTGARSYAYMALAESLLALTEIGSMLAGTQAQALSWFSLRVPFAAIIPVFWLFFAMEYSGRSDWLSKPVRAALFAIPLITQVVMVTGSLHGLWLVQDVGFEKIGPFWIADTGARIPGFWYLVHTFYSTLLLVVGAGALVVSAWRKPKLLLGQALLVSLGALTALGMALVGVFNLLPDLHFNPFVPGIGFSAVCYALAIFRFQFLKHTPTQESIPRMTSLQPQEKRSLAILVLIFVLFTSGLAAIGYLTYQNYEKQFRAQVESQLGAIASLKMDELQNWRTERMGDAEVLYNNPVFAALVQSSFENPEDAQARAQLQAWLDTIRNSYEYDRVFLLDPQGVERISIPAAADPDAVPAALVEHASASLASNEIIFLDFHRHSESDAVHLSMLVPIYDAQDHQPVGTLVLRIDPNIYLYPFIQRWPVPSESGETLLLHRDGEDVLFLNSLRFQSDAALNLRFPLNETELPAVKAALGETGVVEGLDYRNVEVIADIRPVPNSPWFMVSKMDTAEVYAPLRARLWQIILLFGALILAAGVGLMLVWRQQQINYYRAQVETQEALRESEEKFRLAFETSPDAVAITRARDGMFVSVNKGFEQITGYRREEVLGKSSLEINIWKDPEDRRKIVEGLRATGEVRNYETPFLTREGQIYGLMSAAIIHLDGEPHILNITRDITERKQAEADLKESERRFRDMMEQVQLASAMLDVRANITFANDFLLQLTGWKREEIIGRNWFDVFVPEQAAVRQDLFRDLSAGVVPVHYENEILTRTGERRLVAWNNTVLHHSNGAVAGIAGIGVDITERKQAEEALHASEKLLHEMADNYPNSYVSIIEKDLTIGITAGQEFKKQGLDPANFVGLTLEQVFGEHTPLVREHYLKAFGGLETEFELLINNQYQWYRVVPLKGQDGRIERILSVVENITERKQAEEALRHSEQKYRLLFDEMTSGYAVHEIICDPDGKPVDYRFLSVNAAFERMTGLHSADILGRTVLEVLPATEPIWIERYGQVALTREPIQFENYASALGKTFEAHAFSPEPGKFAAIFNDITEHKQAEEQLQKTLDDLKRSNAELEQFAYIASHDLQEPLRAVAGMVQLLQQRYKGQLDGRADEYIGLAVDGATRMQTLINDLLTYSRVERRGNPLQPTDANAALQSALRNLQASIAENGATVTSENLPALDADATQLAQLFQNLVSNAIKFHGERPPQIHVGVEDFGDAWRFSVRDNGIGIEPQYFERIFLVFQRLHTRREYSGTGIGLAICKKIVERHGGCIWVESEPGQGSTFHFTIPRRNSLLEPIKHEGR